MRAIVLAALVLGASSPAVASARAIANCLDTVDVDCADKVLERYDLDEIGDAEVLYLAARARFFGGRFAEAHDLMARAVEAGHPDRFEELDLYARTRDAHQDFVEVEREGRYMVRYRPGLDAVLVEDAFATLLLAETHLAPIIGGPPPAPIVAEIYPTGRIFTEASSLSEKDVKTTGVVALSKWSRLLVTSPRALGKGYPWQDTLAHEYIHQVVSHHSGERAPVWLQEAIAKYLDNRWRDGKDRFKLDPRAESLVAKALRDNELVPFEMMHPSLAKLPSAELAALAYAQLASLMSFVFERAGEDVLPGVLAKVKRGTDPRDALSAAAGFGSFEAMELGWKDWIKQQGLRDLEVEDLPTALDGGGADAMGLDPVMSERKDLSRFVRLGELLLERGHAEAALIEFAKADGPEGERSPLLQTRLAQAHHTLGDLGRARSTLKAALELYPNFTLAWKALAEVELAAGQRSKAIEAFVETVRLDPFDAEVQEQLITLYTKQGDEAAARRHRSQLSILKRGG
ncbi:MAG: tetratricopeptide repeat protein [Deltaproteobacteria bacterium]|nr:MAG: tetratricopeptide repeat protein [Deltaproteobacteria bacterium]